MSIFDRRQCYFHITQFDDWEKTILDVDKHDMNIK